MKKITFHIVFSFMIKICISDADIPVKPLYLSQGLHAKPLEKGRSIWMFLLIELIPLPYCRYTTLTCTHLYTFVSSLFPRFMHINLKRFTYWGMVLLETILLLCKSGNPRNVVKEPQKADHSYRQTVDSHVLESILCMHKIAVHVLLLDNYKVPLGIKKVEIMFYPSIQSH